MPSGMLVLHGPLPSRQVADFLRSHGYEIALIQTHDTVNPLPMVEFPDAHRSDGAIGKLQLLQVIRQNDYVYISTTNPQEEVVVRRVRVQLHVIYGRRGEFSYLSIDLREFESEVSEAETNMAMSAVSQLFDAVKKRRVNLDAYSDMPFGHFTARMNFDYQGACQQIGWQWR